MRGNNSNNSSGRSKGAVYVQSDKVKEAHGQSMYGCVINEADPKNVNIVATIGGNQVSIYRLSSEGKFIVVQIYKDEDEEEVFYCCKFSVLQATRTPILLLGGTTGLVKVVNLATGKMERVLVGHGDSINEISVHIKRTHVIFTASKDGTTRVWNVASGQCIACVSGKGKHEEQVLSVDVCPLNPDWFVTASLDTSIKIWSLAPYQHQIQISENWDDKQKIFPTQIIHIPLFSCDKIHEGFVDCVRWFGTIGIYSKSVHGVIYLWTPFKKLEEIDNKQGLVVTQSEFVIIEELNYKEIELWFFRFSMDVFQTKLACGNGQGQMTVWDVDADTPKVLAELKVGDGRFAVRQTSVLPDGQQIICCCDDGCVYAYQLKVN
eukprot:TRINITY_DN360_c1_g1_i2.p1 TRINITY_DN360_c1_g1~~TRINITY_DN360_c1_g1_i2.p1  ORF type:complete len:377 (-),score=50.86 TRINITY_DN360_c1_g1_i2:161-1291(-)